MRTKTLLIVILPLLFGGIVFAEDAGLPAEALAKAGMTPDSPFYFLERVVEAVRTFFTVGDIKKAERYATLAAERMAEAEAVMDNTTLDKTPDRKLKLVEKTLTRYEDQLVKASYRVEKARVKGKDTKEVSETVTETRQKHHVVLERVLEKVPEKARPAIEHAITVSTKEGLEKAVVEFRQKKVSSNVDYELLKAKCLESGAPPDVCESVDKALKSDFTPKELCENSGMPSEACEQIPDRGLKSFKELEDICAESGGPAEICGTLEDKCKEMGITEPDACFRVLSISSVTTFQATELRAVPKSRAVSETWPEVGTEVGPALSPPEEEIRKRSEENKGGTSGGIGVQIAVKNGQLTIVGLLENSPAEKAGVQVGDKIMAIGSTITKDLTIDEAVQLIKGKIGTNVLLLISKNNGEGIKNISIVRTQITP